MKCFMLSSNIEESNEPHLHICEAVTKRCYTQDFLPSLVQKSLFQYTWLLIGATSAPVIFQHIFATLPITCK